jgi:hypothetical protein
MRWTSDPFGQFRSRITVFPRWGLPLLLVAAIPGIALALLSGLILVTSLLALLLLTLPVYKLIVWGAALSNRGTPVATGNPQDPSPFTSPGSKSIEVRVSDS